MKIEGQGITLWHEDRLWHAMDASARKITSRNVEFIARDISVTASGISDQLTLMPTDEDSVLMCDDSGGYIACFVRKK